MRTHDNELVLETTISGKPTPKGYKMSLARWRLLDRVVNVETFKEALATGASRAELATEFGIGSYDVDCFIHHYELELVRGHRNGNGSHAVDLDQLADRMMEKLADRIEAKFRDVAFTHLKTLVDNAVAEALA